MRSRNLLRWSRRGLEACVLAGAVAIAAYGCHKTAASVPPPVPQVVVAYVVKKDVPVYSEWVGTTEGFVNAQIYPKVSGYLLKQNYTDGDLVRAGQLLFQIDPRQYKAAYDQAVGQLSQAMAENKKNQQDFGRYRPLYDQQIVSKQDYDHVKQAAQASAANVQAARAAVEAAKLNLDWTQVTSPINGVSGIAKTQVGDLVGNTTLLTTVSQLDPIKVEFPISEREYLLYAKKIKEHEETGHSKDEPDLEMVLADGSVYKYRGHFYVANRQVNIETGTIKIQGVFPNPGSILRPGLYAKIRTVGETQPGAILIPPAAVLETQGQYQVAVVGADNKVSLRSVQLGKMAESFRIVESGVSPGERVITEGLQKVSDGMVVAPRPASSANPPASAGGASLSSPVAPAPQS